MMFILKYYSAYCTVLGHTVYVTLKMSLEIFAVAADSHYVMGENLYIILATLHCCTGYVCVYFLCTKAIVDELFCMPVNFVSTGACKVQYA